MIFWEYLKNNSGNTLENSPLSSATVNKRWLVFWILRIALFTKTTPLEAEPNVFLDTERKLNVHETFWTHLKDTIQDAFSFWKHTLPWVLQTSSECLTYIRFTFWKHTLTWVLQTSSECLTYIQFTFCVQGFTLLRGLSWK